VPFSFFVYSFFTNFGIFRVDGHAAFAAPDEDENAFPPHPIAPSPPQSFLMGEGEGEVVFKRFTVHASRFTVFTGQIAFL
jgi:hypothetical protein